MRERAPRVWSRDDFAEAFRLANQSGYQGVLDGTLAVLAFAERNAALHVDQGRDERGRFVQKPQLHADSPIVVSARAEG
jgi:hypothetical protein